MEKLISLLEEIQTSKNIVSFDVPLFIRILELTREELKSDESIHILTQKIIELSLHYPYLDMSNYSDIISSLK